MGSSINASYSTQDYGYSFSKSVTGSGDFYSALRSMIPWTVPYDENGEFEVGAYSDSMNYYEKSTVYECTRCNRNIKAAVLRYKRGMNK
jgi:hypothetical protein